MVYILHTNDISYVLQCHIYIYINKRKKYLLKQQTNMINLYYN